MQENEYGYGVGDTSYKVAGGLQGITRLVDVFYDNMDVLPEAKIIRDMHAKDLTVTRKKLAYFLSGWLGGPKFFSENFGPIHIPSVHKHLSIGIAERDAWLLCMQKAISIQGYEESFKEYLLEQLKVPAERIRVVCAG